MGAIIAVDILAGAFQLSPAQERVLIESQGYVRGGSQVTRPTRKVLVRLGLIEQRARDHYTTAWGDAVGEELVAREAAKGEYLPKIYWKSGVGYLEGEPVGCLDGDRFQLVIHAPGVYALDDTGRATGHTFKTIVHAQQYVREFLAEEQAERDGAYEEAFGDGFDTDPAAYGEDLADY